MASLINSTNIWRRINTNSSKILKKLKMSAMNLSSPSSYAEAWPSVCL
jgi:hypothetical protein